MQIAARINETRTEVFRRRYELSLPMKLALSLCMACLIGLAAQLRFYLPGNPVPITGQTFAVLLSGVLMGSWWGGVSLALYTGLGIAGVPWFTGFGSGLSYLAGPTGGYIAGFILAALFLGYVTENYVRSRRMFTMIALMLFANFILIYVPGLVQLGLWTSLVKGSPVTLTSLLMMGAVPFVIGDGIKAVLAALAASAVTPKVDYRSK